MIENGSKVKLKFDITASGITDNQQFSQKILGHRGTIVEVLGYDKSINLYFVQSPNGNNFHVSPYQIQTILAIPEFEQILPYQTGWYLYKELIDVSPTYCKLIFRAMELQIESGDSGYPIDKMSKFYWLRVG